MTPQKKVEEPPIKEVKTFYNPKDSVRELNVRKKDSIEVLPEDENLNIKWIMSSKNYKTLVQWVKVAYKEEDEAKKEPSVEKVEVEEVKHDTSPSTRGRQ